MNNKKRKLLFFVNTHFQLLTAINMTLKLFPADTVELVISDSSYDMLDKIELLKQNDVFSKIYYLKRRAVLENSNKLFILLRYIFYEPFYNRLLPMDSFDYSEIFFYNFDIFVVQTLKKALKQNPYVKYSRYEEGYVSYFDGDNVSGAIRIGNRVKKLIGKGFDYSFLKKAYYFYEPDFAQFKKKYILETIPKISLLDKNMVQLLGELYNIKKIKSAFSKKYIFLEEPFSFDNVEKVNDFQVILSIAEIVGKENIIVKRHPRSPIDRFKTVGIETCDVVGIPWEVIQLSGDFLTKVLITISSGSVISSKMLFNQPIPVFLLYNCVNKLPKLVNKNYKKHLDNILKKYGQDNFYIPKDLSEFKEQINSLN